jgi:hypothetical protein
VDGAGNTVQLRGVNVSGLETVAAQGWSPSDPWGGMKPQFAALAAWKINAVRFPLNEASWLDYTCVDANNASHDPDPGKNYQQTVKDTVAQATAAGFYVILDLHWSAPGNYCPLAQNAMADTDHSVTFWQQIATTFKDNPAVIFEMFNEPYLPQNATGWSTWLNGGTYTQVALDIPAGGGYKAVQTTWQVAGMNQLISTVRATGATNVILAGGLSYSNDLSGWATNTPQDPQGQLAAAWHIYAQSYPYTDLSAGSSTVTMLAGVNASVPVAITEYGDVDGPGTTAAFAPAVLGVADKAAYSYFAWTWNVWGQGANDLILDTSGTPTVGFGTYVQQHYICRASSTTCQ